MNLYEIAAEYRQQLAALQDLDLPPEVVADTVEGMRGDLESKLRAVIAYSLELDIQAEGAKEAAKRMQDRAKTLAQRVEWLRGYALGVMRDTGTAEVATAEFTAKIAKKPGEVLIADNAVIPDEFCRVKTTKEPDKTKLKEAIASGATFDGVSVVGGFRLAVR